jgi:hypothetical protein
MALTGLTITDFADRDLLYALEESADDSGWASASEVARKIGLSRSKPAQCVGSRFAWLRRFGVMDFKIKNGEGFWRLNETGESLLHGKDMAASVNRALQDLTPAQRIRVTELVSQQIAKEGKGKGRSAAHLSRRAWRNSMGAWKDPRISIKR